MDNQANKGAVCDVCAAPLVAMGMVFNRHVALALIRALPDLVGGVRVCSAYDMGYDGFCLSVSSLGVSADGDNSSVFVDATYDGKRLLSLVFANEAEALAGVRDMAWAILSGLEAIEVGLVANAPCLPVDASVGAVSGASGGVKAVKRGKGGVAVKKTPVKPVKSKSKTKSGAGDDAGVLGVVRGVVKKRGSVEAVIKGALGYDYAPDALCRHYPASSAVCKAIGLPVLEVA